MTALSNEPTVHPDCVIRESKLGRYTEIGSGSHILNSTLGDYTYCARLCDIANAEIGKFSSIASMARIGPTDHPMDRASMHHFMYRSEMYWPDAEDDTEFFALRAARRLTIGHDTWIGHGAIIRPEVSIGHGSVVAAGAVVTKDVPPYTIVTGVPASPMRRRHPGRHRRAADRPCVVGLGPSGCARRVARLSHLVRRGLPREIWWIGRYSASTTSWMRSPTNQVRPYSTNHPSGARFSDSVATKAAPSRHLRCSAWVAVASSAEIRVVTRT